MAVIKVRQSTRKTRAGIVTVRQHTRAVDIQLQRTMKKKLKNAIRHHQARFNTIMDHSFKLSNSSPELVKANRYLKYKSKGLNKMYAMQKALK